MNSQEKIIVRDEVDRLAAVWSLRALLHPQAFQRFSRSFVTVEEEVFQVVGLEHINLEIICAAELHQIMKNQLKTLEEHHVQRNAPLFRNIDHIGRMVGLSELEKEILLMATILQNSPGLEEALKYLGSCNIPGLINNLSYILKIRPKHIAAALRSDGPLCSSGLIDLQRKRRSLDIGGRLEALDGLAHVLQDPHAEVESALSTFFCKVPSPNLTMADFEHLGDDLTIVSALLATSVQKGVGGVNILFYGPPGTGKTELVRVLASHLGISLYEVSSQDNEGDPATKDQRFRSYLLCQSLFSRRSDCLILFDEIEDIFPSESQGIFGIVIRSGPHKSWTNRILENNKFPAIWISNRVAQIDPAFLRRFDLILEVPSPPPGVRQQMLRRMAACLEIRDEVVKDLGNNQNIVPGHLEKAFKVAKLVGGHDQASSEQVLTRVVSNLHKAMGLPAGIATFRPKTQFYDLAFLNTDLNMERLVEICQIEPIFKACLHGPSGTGKTAFVHYLAEHLNKKIIAKKTSDILEPYVGQTEQRLATMFHEAEQTDGLLFLDEADSFLQSRSRARHTWEITKVNELLVQLENYRGLFFCATNLMETLDNAVFRRFDLKVRFNFLKSEQAWELFKQILAVHGADLPKDQDMWCRTRLAKLSKLTPADFTLVERQLKFTQGGVDAHLFLDYLEQESFYKGGEMKYTVGF